MATIFELMSGKFLTADQMAGVTNIAAAVGTIGVGVAFLMISGEFDLSVGAMYAFIPIVTGKLIVEFHWTPWLAFATGMAVALAFGLGHGIITTVLRIPSFITTLGTLFVLTGLDYLITGGYPIDFFEKNSLFTVLGHQFGSTGAFAAPFVWMLGIALMLWLVLTCTRYGNWTYAAGSRAGVARAMGVPVRRVKTANFMIASGLAGFAGIAQFAQLGSISAGFGQDYNLLAIVAAVLGGTSLFGVIGSIPGTVLGALILASLQTGLVLVGAPGQWYTSMIGIILLFVVILNVRLENVQFGAVLKRRT